MVSFDILQQNDGSLDKTYMAGWIPSWCCDIRESRPGYSKETGYIAMTADQNLQLKDYFQMSRNI
jgi:hypothetical protein